MSIASNKRHIKDSGVARGAAKLRLYLKTKNREDLKKGRQKNWGAKNNLGGDKKIFRGGKKFLRCCAKKRSSKFLGGVKKFLGGGQKIKKKVVKKFWGIRQKISRGAANRRFAPGGRHPSYATD